MEEKLKGNRSKIEEIESKFGKIKDIQEIIEQKQENIKTSFYESFQD